MTVIGKYSPCLYLDLKAFHLVFSPCPFEEGEGWVGFWEL